MAKPPSGEISQLLIGWNSGDQAARDRLLPLVYDELRRMAKRHMGRQNPGRTLQTTALIHEAYLRLVSRPRQRWQNRAHFFAVGAQAMRHILVDYARSRHSAKRGGGARGVSLDEAAVMNEPAAELVALDEALTELAALHARQGRVVECRFFGGLTVEETAEALQVSRDTVMRDWRMAKAWLQRALRRSGPDDA
jgi:RNA polymerase sigma factor (TIGR02999 family)